MIVNSLYTRKRKTCMLSLGSVMLYFVVALRIVRLELETIFLAMRWRCINAMKRSGMAHQPIAVVPKT